MRLGVARLCGDLTASGARAVNALLANQVRLDGFGDAFVTSVNRASGAALAGSTEWQNRQLQLGRGYARSLAQLWSQRGLLLANVAAALQAPGFPTIPLTAAGFSAFEQMTARSGLPSVVVHALTALGVGDRSTTAAIGTADPTMVRALNASPGFLTSPALAGADRTATRLLREFANGGS